MQTRGPNKYKRQVAGAEFSPLSLSLVWFAQLNLQRVRFVVFVARFHVRNSRRVTLLAAARETMTTSPLDPYPQYNRHHHQQTAPPVNRTIVSENSRDTVGRKHRSVRRRQRRRRRPCRRCRRSRRCRQTTRTRSVGRRRCRWSYRIGLWSRATNTPEACMFVCVCIESSIEP